MDSKQLDLRMAKRATQWVGMLVLTAAPALAASIPVDTHVRLQAAGIEIGQLSLLTTDVMAAEISALLSPAGLHLDWRAAPPSGETAPDELRVVFLDAPGRGAYAGRPVLAASGQAGPAPTIWVFTPTVVAALNLGAAAPLESLLAQRALGVALGRVLAHEIVHLLAPEIPHRGGLMSPRFRFTALQGSRPRLDGESARALATAARAWLARGGPGPETERRARLAATLSAEDAAGR